MHHPAHSHPIHPHQQSGHAAVFYDMDGTMVSTNLVHSFLFMSSHEPSIPQSVVKTLKGIAKLPAFLVTDQLSRTAFNEILFAGYKGTFRDRLLEFAEEHFEQVLKPNIFPGIYELVENAQKSNLRQVIVSGSLDFMVQPLARHLGIHDIITNRLEFKDHVATGKLVKPVVAGAAKARLIQEYSRKHEIDLLASYAYSDSYSDYPMLAVVGRPGVINPDRKLKRAAEELNWPVIDVK